MGQRNEAENVMNDQAVEIGRSLLGVRFRHQGRDPKTGVDCVGFCVVIAQEMGVDVKDMTVYHRTPSATRLREMLEKILTAIPVTEATVGDVLLMRLGGIKPRHVALLSGDGKIIHALNSLTINRVVEQDLNIYRHGVVAAYRFEV